MIEDLIFGFGNVIFAFLLIPMVRDVIVLRKKANISTCLGTGVVLAIFALTYASMGFLWSMLVTSVTASLWLVMFVYSVRNIPDVTDGA